jgi:hypothetical protein
MAKVARDKLDTNEPEPAQDTVDAGRQAILEKKYRASRSAFNSWETAQIRTDQHLYTALGRLAEFAAAVGNDHQTLIEFAAARGVRATKASTPYTVTARLIVADRKKTNKYATVLHLAARRGIEPTEDRIAEFIKAEGGIEACLRSFRKLPREGGPAKGGGRPSAFGKAMERIGGFSRIEAPAGLELAELSGDYFLVVGVRHADGTTHLLQQPVTDEQVVRKAVATMAPKE